MAISNQVQVIKNTSSWWHTLHLRTQISIYFLFIIISMSVIMSCIYYVCWFIIWNIFTEASKAILIRDNLAFTNDILNKYTYNANQMITRSGTQLQQADKLLHLMLSSNIELPKAQACLMPFNTNSYVQQSCYCYGWFALNVADLQNTIDNQAVKFVSLLNLIIPLIDPSTAIFFSTSTDSLFYSSYRNKQPLNFNPHSNPWFTNNSEAIQNFVNLTFFSDPYIDKTTGKLYIAQQKSLTNLTYNYIGVIAQALSPQGFNFIQQSYNSMSISIIDQFGKLLLVTSGRTGNIYIQNKSITGFDEQLTFDEPYENTCLDKIIYTKGQLCLYNPLYKVDLIIQTRYLPDMKFIIILSYTLVEAKIALNEHTAQLFDQLFEYQTNGILIFTCTVIVLSLGTIFIIINILNTISRVTLLTTRRIYSNSLFKELLRQTKQIGQAFISKDILFLEQAFQQFCKNIDKQQICKSKECMRLDDIEFPKNIPNYQQQFSMNLKYIYYLEHFDFSCNIYIIKAKKYYGRTQTLQRTR